jgi:hypothetical protein
MIWHIFRKDARLLWPAAALVVALHVCAAIPRYLMDHGTRTVQLEILSDLLAALALLGAMVVVVVAIHQDPIPGVRQDWLVRPIRHRDLALAKGLFVLLMVQLPLWLVDVGVALVHGFALPDACAAAATRNIGILCEFALPAMMIGAVTRSFVEAFMVSAVALVIYIALFMVGLSMMLGIKMTVTETGAAWMFSAAFELAALIGTVLILGLQYSGRRTVLARSLVGVGGALVIAVAFMPWRVAFAMQMGLSPESGTARRIAVAFDPQAGPYYMPMGAAPAVTHALQVPIRFTDLPANSLVLMDRADVRITGLDGTTLYQNKTSISADGLGSILDAQFNVPTGANDGSAHVIYQRIYLPSAVLGQLINRQVRMSIDYSLTLFGLSHTLAVPATGALETLPGLGRCATGIDAEGDDVGIGCLSTSRQASCYSVHLENPTAGLRNPELHTCFPDYSPPWVNQFWPDAIHRTGGEVRFFDRTGMVHYPVDGSKLADAKLMITTYEPREHFTRHIDTPIVRLADLVGMAALAAPTR